MLVADVVSDAAREEGFVLRRHHDMLRGGRHYKQDRGSAIAGSRGDEEKNLKRLTTERVEDVQQARPVKVYEECWCSSLLVQGRCRLLKSASAVACGPPVNWRKKQPTTNVSGG